MNCAFILGRRLAQLKTKAAALEKVGGDPSRQAGERERESEHGEHGENTYSKQR